MLPFRIALRYLFTKKNHNAVNIISIVSMVGVGVATAAIVCVLSVFNGFSDLSLSQMSVVSPDLRVSPRSGKTIGQADSLATVIASVDGVKDVAERISEKALAVYRNRQMPVEVMAFSDNINGVVDYESILIEGEMAGVSAVDTNIVCAALSPGVAGRLGVHPGYYDWLALYAPRRRGRVNVANPMSSFVSDSLVVSGVYEAKNMDTDLSTMIVPLATARRLFDYDTQATSLEIALLDGADVSRKAKEIERLIGSDYRVMSRLEQHENSFRMIEIEKWITFAMLAFILLIASFNVISTISMLIIEKDESIFALRAMGAKNSSVRMIFVIEGWLITMVGAIVGIVVGVIASLAQQYGEFIKLNADPQALTVLAYPVRLQLLDIAAILLLTALVGWIVGLAASLFIPRPPK